MNFLPEENALEALLQEGGKNENNHATNTMHSKTQQTELYSPQPFLLPLLQI